MSPSPFPCRLPRLGSHLLLRGVCAAARVRSPGYDQVRWGWRVPSGGNQAPVGRPRLCAQPHCHIDLCTVAALSHSAVFLPPQSIWGSIPPTWLDDYYRHEVIQVGIACGVTVQGEAVRVPGARRARVCAACRVPLSAFPVRPPPRVLPRRAWSLTRTLTPWVVLRVTLAFSCEFVRALMTWCNLRLF